MKLCKLEKFLINRGLLESFKANLWNYSGFKTIDYYKKVTGTHTFVIMTIRWEVTPEGYDFWQGVHREWLMALKNNTI